MLAEQCESRPPWETLHRKSAHGRHAVLTGNDDAKYGCGSPAAGVPGGTKCSSRPVLATGTAQPMQPVVSLPCLSEQALQQLLRADGCVRRRCRSSVARLGTVVSFHATTYPSREACRLKTHRRSSRCVTEPVQPMIEVEAAIRKRDSAPARQH